MERTEIRLECLKLAHSLGRDPAEAIGRAKIYEEYIVGQKDEAEKKAPQKPFQKKSGNSSILD